MPTPTRYRNKTNTYSARNTYSRTSYDRGRVYSGASTAYDMPGYYPDVRKTENVQKKKPAEVQKKKTKLVLTRDVRQVITAVSVLFLLCIGVLCRYATILSSNRRINDLEKQYNTIISSNQAMQAKIDKQLEMGEIEKYAREELGMMKAESYQKFYIDMNMPDEGTIVKSGSRAQNAVSGVPGTLMNAFRVLK